jgi:hypothetical protein
MINALLFAVQGLIGALIAVLLWSEKWSDLVKFESLRHLIVGSIAGYIYWLLHSTYDFPNMIMATVSGYFAKDFLESIFERLKKFMSNE